MHYHFRMKVKIKVLKCGLEILALKNRYLFHSKQKCLMDSWKLLKPILWPVWLRFLGKGSCMQDYLTAWQSVNSILQSPVAMTKLLYGTLKTLWINLIRHYQRIWEIYFSADIVKEIAKEKCNIISLFARSTFWLLINWIIEISSIMVRCIQKCIIAMSAISPAFDKY